MERGRQDFLTYSEQRAIDLDEPDFYEYFCLKFLDIVYGNPPLDLAFEFTFPITRTGKREPTANIDRNLVIRKLQRFLRGDFRFYAHCFIEAFTIVYDACEKKENGDHRSFDEILDESTAEWTLINVATYETEVDGRVRLYGLSSHRGTSFLRCGIEHPAWWEYHLHFFDFPTTKTFEGYKESYRVNFCTGPEDKLPSSSDDRLVIISHQHDSPGSLRPEDLPEICEKSSGDTSSLQWGPDYYKAVLRKAIWRTQQQLHQIQYSGTTADFPPHDYYEFVDNMDEAGVVVTEAFLKVIDEVAEAFRKGVRSEDEIRPIVISSIWRKGSVGPRVIDLLRQDYGLRRKGQPDSQDFISLDEPIETGEGEKIDKHDRFTPPDFTIQPGVPTFRSVKSALLWWYDCDPEGAFRNPPKLEPRYHKRNPQPYVLPEWYMTWLDIGNAVSQLPDRDQEKVKAFLTEKGDELDRSLSIRLGKLLTRSGIQHR